MKYYIRTLRTNLDNILSSESISPYSYYVNRGYGYQRLERMKDDTEDHALRIETKIVGDGEDVIYVEIDSDDEQLKGSLIEKNKDYFYINKPFYLYPWNCRILFRNKDEANSSVIICRSSLTNKMWNYYPTGIIEGVEKTNDREGKNGSVPTKGSGNDVEVDKKRNRLKGFLFAYYWGYYKSISPELARLLQAELRIYGLATVLAGMRYPSTEILIEIDQQKKFFNMVDPNRALLKSRWEEDVLKRFSTREDGQLFESLMGRLGVKKQAMDAFAAEQQIEVSPRLETSNMATMNWKMFASQMDAYTQKQIERYLTGKSIPQDRKVKTGVDGCVEAVDSLYVRVLNEIIKGNDWLSPERISSQKLEVANKLTFYVKAFYEIGGHQWEGSFEQAYLDAMRRNIANSEPFDPNKIANSELRALAVYILKGDLMDEMLKYMQVSAVEDYSLVLGLWGAATGYVNIPKTFMQKAFLPEEKASDCYVRSYESLTGMKMTAELNPSSFASGIKRQEAISVLPNKMVESKPSIQLLEKSALKLTREQIRDIEEIIEFYHGRLDEMAFKQIGKIKGIGKKKIEQLRCILKPNAVKEQENLLFKDVDHLVSGKDFTPDDVLRIVLPLLPNDEKVREQVRKDVLWYLSDGRGDKRKLIMGLGAYLRRNKNSAGKRMWVRKLYEEVDVDLIEKSLRESYL